MGNYSPTVLGSSKCAQEVIIMSYDEAKRVFDSRMTVEEKVGHLQVFYNGIRGTTPESMQKLRHNFWVFSRNERVARALVGGCDWTTRVFKVHIPPSVYRGEGRDALTQFLETVRGMGGSTIAHREGSVWWGQFAPSNKKPTEEEKETVEKITTPAPKVVRMRGRPVEAFKSFVIEDD